MHDSTLTANQKELLRQRWAPYGIGLDEGLRLRRLARQDLWFLATDLLGYNKFVERVHREVFDHFVQKDADAPDFETFARAYHGLHDRLLMLPRGGFKSTADIVDKVQWIICFPDIRINILTDRLELSQEFVGGIKGHFTLELNGDPKPMPNGEPSMFQILFYEFCDTAPASYSGNQTPQWTTPARRDRSILSPTIRARGLDAGKTGTHCDLLAIDDAITPESVGTGKSVAGNLRNIETKIGMARKLVTSYGFIDNIGTPQHALDYNSQTVAREKKRAQEGLAPLTQVLIRPAMTVRPEYAGRTLDELEEYMVEMWCPEILSFQYLKEEWHRPAGRDTVATQYLLDVSLKQMVKFTREQLVRATIPPQRIPQGGTMVIPWDLAYSQTDRADFTVGLPTRIAGGRFYVLDKIRGRFNEDELPKMIALTIYKWMPDRVAIENSQGAKWLRKEIQREMEALGCPDLAIEYVDIGQGVWRRNEVNAGPTVRLLGNERLFFSTAVPKIEELYDELEAFPNPAHKDDIVACLNLAVNYFMTEAELTVQAGHLESESPGDSHTEHLWQEQMFGYGRGTRPEPIEVIAPAPRDGYGLLPDVLGGLPE